MVVLKVLLYCLIFLVAFIIAFILLLTVSSYAVPCDYSDKNSAYYRWLLNTSVFFMLLGMRTRVHVKGMEKIPEDTRFLLVGNHLSKFDPIIEWYAFKKADIAFISKQENFSVPWFGRIIRKCCFMPIDRENPANAAKTLKRAEKLISSGEVSIGVYPEETRGKGDRLGEFHNGMFHIAKATGKPIVVCMIRNTPALAKNFPLRGTDVYLEVVDVIPAEFVKENRTTQTGERVRKDLEVFYPV